MTITLEFYVVCNYTPDAVRVTEELVEAFGRGIAALTLVPSSGGVFEVTVNGTPVFSKKSLQRKPRPGEVAALVRATGNASVS